MLIIGLTSGRGIIPSGHPQPAAMRGHAPVDPVWAPGLFAGGRCKGRVGGAEEQGGAVRMYELNYDDRNDQKQS